jgi:hypothetical protein
MAIDVALDITNNLTPQSWDHFDEWNAFKGHGLDQPMMTHVQRDIRRRYIWRCAGPVDQMERRSAVAVSSL